MLFMTLFACAQSEAPMEETKIVQTVPQKVEIEEVAAKKEELDMGFQVFFTNEAQMMKGGRKLLESVERNAQSLQPQVVLDALYAGPLESEKGLVLTRCQSTGAKVLSLDNGVLSVQLEGGCGGCGTHSIYDLMLPTVLQLDSVSVLHLYDPQGKSQIESSSESARPACLEP